MATERKEEEEGTQVHIFNVHQILEDSRQMLQTGELLACPTFELQSAMTAREIGDPRMDPGVHRYDQRTLSERVAAGEAPLDIEREAMLAVFDRIVQLEIGWQDQYMLSQTVYTCLYMMDLERTLANPVLHAYCCSVHVVCCYFLQLVYDARVCSDEDVAVAVPGIHMDEIKDDDMVGCLSYLDDAIGNLQSGGECIEEVMYRLQFRKLMVTALLGIQHANTRDDLNDIIQLCRDMMSIVEGMSPASDNVLAVGFAPTLHEADIGPMPIRELKMRSMEEAWGVWKARIKEIMGTCEWLVKVQSWEDLKKGLDVFAAQDNHGFVRSMMYRLIVNPTSNPKGWVPWSPNIAMLVKEILLEEPDVVFFKAMNALPDLEMFLNQCVIAVQGCCHVKCLNRVRQRRRMKHNILDWKNMIGHAYNAETSADVRVWLKEKGFSWNTSYDSIVQSNNRLAPLTCWVVREATWTCIHHLLLGGPLELYEPEEISSIYWYVSYLLDYSEHMAKEYDSISMDKKLGAAKRSNNVKGIDLENTLVSPPAGPLRDSWMRRKLAMFFGFALGSISRISSALKAYGLLPRMKHEFNGRHDQYMQRFDFMQAISLPDFLDYSSYMEYEYHLAGTTPSKDPETGIILEGPIFDTKQAYALLQQSSDYINTCVDILLSLESLVPSPMFSQLKRTMSANKTALHLLATLATKTDISAEFSASWIFLPVGQSLIPWEFSTVVIGLPILTLQRIHKDSQT